jgi:hypothetical protein
MVFCKSSVPKMKAVAVEATHTKLHFESITYEAKFSNVPPRPALPVFACRTGIWYRNRVTVYCKIPSTQQ